MSPARIKMAKEQIIAFFETQHQKVFTPGQLLDILVTQRNSWQLTKSTTPSDFVQFLLHETNLSEHRFAFGFRPTTLYLWGEWTFCLLSGMNTGMLGVTQEQLQPEQIDIRVTSLERTLIDITVRPMYAGGVQEVIEAYKRASECVSIRRLASLLKKIQYVYPYHQAIGFYVEKAGCYDDAAIRVFGKLPRKYDFYLDYEMEKVAYSTEWRLYYPQELGTS